jgi:hypothetical protein
MVGGRTFSYSLRLQDISQSKQYVDEEMTGPLATQYSLTALDCDLKNQGEEAAAIRWSWPLATQCSVTLLGPHAEQAATTRRRPLRQCILTPNTHRLTIIQL